MKQVKRCLAVLLVAVMLVCGAVGVSALAVEEEPPVSSTGTIWSDWATDMPDCFGNALATVTGFFSQEVCPVSSDHLHHGKVTGRPPLGSSSAWIAKCDYCSDPFTVFDDDMQNAYNERTSSLPAPMYTSTNQYHWPMPTVSYSLYYENETTILSASLGNAYSFEVNATYDRDRLDVYFAPFSAPIDGVYTASFYNSSSGLIIDGRHNLIYFSDDESEENSWYTAESYGIDPRRTYSAGDSILGERSHFKLLTWNTGVIFSSGYWVMNCAPVSISPSYSIDTRIGSIVGNFINGDVTYENIQIVNETTNVYYNPVTGQNTSITNWMYDYGDRSYELTLEGGAVVKVVFGDENVQLNEGETIYNIQYAVSEGGGEVVDPTPTPTPEPTPSPSPGPGPGGDDEDTGFLASILAAIKGIWETIKGLGQSIIDGILNGLKSLFVPSDDTLNSFSGEVDAKLPIIGDLQGLGDDLVSVLENPAQSANDLRMTTVVDLGAGEGQISGTAQINLLDVSWYLEYKPLVDDVIVGFVWLVFLWNLFGQLPSIIHGGASALHTTSEIQKAQDDAAKDWARRKWG